ncbi:MAG: glycerol-3-phosphate dehydrogenase [Betaproteobacteria bacterium RIFCSPLOWO2_12_FULL_65_14]|nr:MAG: glycerol-3-phosphate dehydrogenase [Betaproteobacteria bacterium RIFCSPLOWO2_12_FULL_65_14]
MPGNLYDLLVIGGGINGAGIARDAAGRGLSVLLVEAADLAAATSSASSKLIHGGLRYLEQYDFRLVAEALAEREILLRIAAHLASPMRFVMPHVPELRPRWMIRIGLFLYDHLARRSVLPGSRQVRLDAPPYRDVLRPEFRHGFAYSDCRVDDARLVVANARDAAARGAHIRVRTQCVSARRTAGRWHAVLSGGEEASARAVVNVAGPWVKQVLNERLGQPSRDEVRLVQGSHIVVPRLYEGGHAYILQNDDRRVVFMIPFEERFTLIGTTEVPLQGDPASVQASDAEVEYLCRAASRYLAQPVAPSAVRWRFAGVRPLYDDGSRDPSAVTRDYTLRVDDEAGAAPALSVFGGKITTYRRLAEHALEKLVPYFPMMKRAWTESAPFPGSEFADRDTAFGSLSARFPGLPGEVLRGVFRRHGALAPEVLGDGRLGEDYGAGLTEREVQYFVEREWATSAEDVLWRRSKAGLHMSDAQRRRLLEVMGR